MSEAESGYWQQVEEIFHQALDIPVDARSRFLSEHCGGNTALGWRKARTPSQSSI
jgi:hypothetical protein